MDIGKGDPAGLQELQLVSSTTVDTAHARLVSESLLDHTRSIAAGVTASIGLVSLDRLPDLKSEAALRAADEALYEAKRTGRDRVAEWAPTADSVIPASD